MTILSMRLTALTLAAAAATAACGGGSGELPALAQLAAAQPASLSGTCADLLSKVSFPNTTFTAVNSIAAGTLTVAGKPVAAHCQVTGKMNQRTSAVDGNTYAIGFEMRLPLDWNGRFFHQVNGGTDGNIGTAAGGIGGGGPLSNALNMGFAVISTDAGHVLALGSAFGLDPQARLDYGYQAVGTVTPMAKAVIATAYGKGPDRSYIGGCSNGGRHTMVAASRYAKDYDGFLVGDPGFRLPLAAIANMAGAQAYSKLATDPADIGTGFTAAERSMVSAKVLAKCDALDGAADGLVQDTSACQAAFNLDTDVPTCSGARDGTCLTTAQKSAIAQLFSGARTATGKTIYTSFPWDAGLGTSGWAVWKFTNSLSPARDPGAVGMIWQVPPVNPTGFDGTKFALTGDLDDMIAKVNATNALYTESAMSFMTPPDPTNLKTLATRGAKVLAYHGTSDPIFSSDDTVNWYVGLSKGTTPLPQEFARLFLVPGMNHCSGGPATDQFDMLTPLVNWVEKGAAPDRVVASARGTGNAGGVNADVPATWSATRTRPLCAWPKVARYTGSGSVEDAANFSCQ